jgi:DNA-binding transcriptional MerR regulator
MYSIKDTAKLLSLNENQIRRRLNFFDEHIKIIHGKQNRILINDDGLKTLQEIESLEIQGLSLQSIQELLLRHEQFQTSSPPSDLSVIPDVEQLEAENCRLRNEISTKDEHITVLSSVIVEYLPEEAHNKLGSITAVPK